MHENFHTQEIIANNNEEKKNHRKNI